MRRSLHRRFIEKWAPLARYCKENEPNTITYELSESTSDAEAIVIYERYPLRRHLTDVHNHSQPFKEVRADANGQRERQGPPRFTHTHTHTHSC